MIKQQPRAVVVIAVMIALAALRVIRRECRKDGNGPARLASDKDNSLVLDDVFILREAARVVVVASVAAGLQHIAAILACVVGVDR